MRIQQSEVRKLREAVIELRKELEMGKNLEIKTKLEGKLEQINTTLNTIKEIEDTCKKNHIKQKEMKKKMDQRENDILNTGKEDSQISGVIEENQSRRTKQLLKTTIQRSNKTKQKQKTKKSYIERTH